MTEADRQVGIIGVGLVGTALAERLIGAGYRITGYDLRPEPMDVLRRMGAGTACSAIAVAEKSTRLILSLPTSDIVATVLQEIAGKLLAGSILVDTTTGSPDDSVSFAQALGKDGVDYVDATIGGSSTQVRKGEAIFLCGGAGGAFERCSDLWSACCRQAFHVGPAGSGARMKLVLNLVLGLNRAVLAEGLEFARASGIDPAQALEILKAGPAYSRVMDAKGRRMLADDFEPEARLAQHLKDVRLILACGERAGATLPLSLVHRALLEAAEAAGFGGEDNSAIIKVFRKAGAR